MESKQEINLVNDDPAPPILKTWKKLYAFVLGNLFVFIILFYIFTKVFE
jgi:hypothetical protein